MKLAKGAIGAALDRPDPATRFYLFHGADESGSRALARRLLVGLAAEKHAIATASLRSDPALLADEAGAISMFGGKRLLWVEPAGDEICAALSALLEAPAVEHPVVAIAGALRKTSVLLKLAEAHPAALAQISYVPEGRDADRLVLELGRAEGLRIAPLLASRLAQSCGNDQAVIRQELTKYAIYLNASPDVPQELSEELLASIGIDGSEGDSGRPIDLALSGDLSALSAELECLESSGIEPVPVLRAAQRRLLMLVPLRARIEAGQSPDAVMASVFWKDKALISRIISRWTSARLAQAIERIARLERELLLSQVSGRAALGQELLEIGRAAAR